MYKYDSLPKEITEQIENDRKNGKINEFAFKDNLAKRRNENTHQPCHQNSFTLWDISPFHKSRRFSRSLQKERLALFKQQQKNSIFKKKDKVLLQEITTLLAYSGCEIMFLAMRLGCSISVSINFLSPGQYFIVTASTLHWHRHNLLCVYMFHSLC